MSHYTIDIDIRSPWHIGSGEEGGSYADDLVLKDRNHCPYIPGKSLKGLLRHAFNTAQSNGWLGSELSVDQLFGQSMRQGEYSQGIIQVSNGQLSSAEQQFFKQQPGAAQTLYSTLQSTAIDRATGTAKAHSLRSIEVVIPMQLRAEISLNQAHPLYAQLNLAQFGLQLSAALSLIHNIGAKRHRGFGDVVMTCREGQQ